MHIMELIPQVLGQVQAQTIPLNFLLIILKDFVLPLLVVFTSIMQKRLKELKNFW